LDGLPDVSLLAANKDILVFWNDASGELGTAVGATVTRVASLGTDEYTDTLAFGWLNADADPYPELALLSYEGLWLAKLETSSRQYAQPQGAQLLPSDALEYGGEVLATGDFDGDGIEDIAVGESSSYTILRGGRTRP